MGYQLGVDLGTTFIAAAISVGGSCEMISLEHDRNAAPSVVALTDDGITMFGTAALTAASTDPTRAAREFKRRFGDPIPVLLGATPFAANLLYAQTLRWVVDQVAELQGEPPGYTVVTHPANWGDYKLDLLRQAVEVAGLNEYELLAEPIAAAIHYDSRERVQEGDAVAVYDLGGGTFDAAVLRRTADSYEILGRAQGVERLGGIDFDAAVWALVVGALDDPLSDLDEDDPAARQAVARLKEECTKAKVALSFQERVKVPVLLPGVSEEVMVRRDELIENIAPLLEETLIALERAIAGAGLEADDLDAILLVGGSSRIPTVSELIFNRLGVHVALDSHPKHAVALGAALRAEAHGDRPGGSTNDKAKRSSERPTPAPPPPGPDPTTPELRATPTPPPTIDPGTNPTILRRDPVLEPTTLPREPQDVPAVTVNVTELVSSLVAPRIVVAAGPMTGRWFDIPLGHTPLGREELDPTERVVSRFHLDFVRDGQQVTVEDTKSKNGTLLDGVRLPPGQPVPLTTGAMIEIGPYLLLFEDSTTEPASPLVLAHSVEIPPLPMGGGVFDRFRQRRRRAEWLDLLAGAEATILDRHRELGRSRRAAARTAGQILARWSRTRRDSAAREDSPEPMITIGFADQPTLLALDTPKGVDGELIAVLDQLRQKVSVDTDAPVDIPLLPQQVITFQGPHEDLIGWRASALVQIVASHSSSTLPILFADAQPDPGTVRFYDTLPNLTGCGMRGTLGQVAERLTQLQVRAPLVVARADGAARAEMDQLLQAAVDTEARVLWFGSSSGTIPHNAHLAVTYDRSRRMASTSHEGRLALTEIEVSALAPSVIDGLELPEAMRRS